MKIEPAQHEGRILHKQVVSKKYGVGNTLQGTFESKASYGTVLWRSIRKK